ncbi:putative antiporter CaxA [Globicephala melas]|uniref:putative antiporter CaxA n=1 Tax=Globicephala melas TaxID=9731 RepID=UPI00293D5DA4|nr:putative antiporter CaxA [Globicephala melas]
MLLDIVLFVVSILLILGSANLLTDGAAGLTRRLGINPLVIGLTIIAFGTSAPELVVSLSSALKGSGDIALGNAIGSNIFNNLAVIGITAMISPLAVKSSTIKREIPLLFLGSLVLAVMLLDNLFGQSLGSLILTRGEGLTLLAFFAIFLAYSLAIAKDDSNLPISPDSESSQTEDKSNTERPLYWLIIFIILGLAGLVFGGDLFVSSSVNLARIFGVSEGMIGLTIVALGTSLPELATAIIAALKKEPELAMGNVVGSGIFNIFCILGLTASVSPFEIKDISTVDIIILVLSSMLLYLFGAFFGDKVIKRWEGAMLVLFFLAYNVYLIGTV